MMLISNNFNNYKIILKHKEVTNILIDLLQVDLMVKDRRLNQVINRLSQVVNRVNPILDRPREEPVKILKMVLETKISKIKPLLSELNMLIKDKDKDKTRTKIKMVNKLILLELQSEEMNRVDKDKINKVRTNKPYF